MATLASVVVVLALRWLCCTCLDFSPGLADRAVMYVCANSTLTLPWTLSRTAGDSVLDVQWFYQGDSHVIIATMAADVFFASPTYAGRVETSTHNVGIRIRHVTALETGNYTVEVIGHQAGGDVIRLRHSVYVHIADSLQTSDGQLHIRQQPQPEYQQSTGQLHIVLTCGKFVYPTHPPFQVLWSTPTGAPVNSSAYKDGNFLLHLPNPPPGGVYHCTVPPSLACVQDNAGEATLTLDQTEARMTVLEAGQSRLMKMNAALERDNKQLQAEVGHLRELSTQAVSFHARMLSNLQLAADQVVVMGEVLHNRGQAYDRRTGLFTSPYNGTYCFLASTESTTAHRDATLSLRVDGQELDLLWVTSDVRTKAGGVQAVVDLAVGQKVWLQTTLNSSYWAQPSTFTGFLLHRDG